MQLATASSILITGGAGFLGRGILHYLDEQGSNARVTVYSRDEHKHHELRGRYPGVRTVVGDVRDLDRLRAIVPGHDLVIHAAAMKHIPEAERDVSEAVATNVQGTENVAIACMYAGVSAAVFVSTDKAVEPLNAYGATKMLGERLWQEYSRLSRTTRFISVRYGNVAASTGSAIPVFREQIARDGGVTITSPQMTRFWLPVTDAVGLIDMTVEYALPGETGVYLCHAAPVTTVAQLVWHMAGNYGHVPNRVVGVRPAEKLHETLLAPAESRYVRRPLTIPADAVFVPPALLCTGEAASTTLPYSSDGAPEVDIQTLQRWVEEADRV